MEEQRLRAEGLKQAKILEAEGLAFALERVGQAAQTEQGQRALQYMFGKASGVRVCSEKKLQ